MKENIRTLTVGEIVAGDNRTATVFKEAGIDFCCGGKKTLEESCSEKGIDIEELVASLEQADTIPGAVRHDFRSWDPGFLSDYIINVHHSFVRKNLPEVLFFTQKIAQVHGDNHPELLEVADLFARVNDELLEHLEKEEKILFPAIKEFASGKTQRSRDAISSQTELLLDEHESAGGALDRINAITGGYKLPADACNSYRLAFSLLEKFEDDLHMHVHLENNILFPGILKAIN